MVYHTHFKNAHSLVGYEQDARLLRRVLPTLGFTFVLDMKNVPADTMLVALREKAHHFSFEMYDMLLVVLMSHGWTESIIGNDDEHMRLDELFSLFTHANCPTLKHKPKCFVIQACRGSHHMPVAAAGTFALSADFLFAYPQPLGYVSYVPVGGSDYIQTLGRVLREQHKSEHFVDILTNVASQMPGDRYASSFTTQLQKKLYLHPPGAEEQMTDEMKERIRKDRIRAEGLKVLICFGPDMDILESTLKKVFPKRLVFSVQEDGVHFRVLSTAAEVQAGVAQELPGYNINVRKEGEHLILYNIDPGTAYGVSVPLYEVPPAEPLYDVPPRLPPRRPRRHPKQSPRPTNAVRILCKLGMEVEEAKKQVREGKIDLLPYRDNITDASVMALADHCPGLTWISVRKSNHITDASVIALANRCHGLTTIILSYCENITDASVMALAERCPGLTRIGLYGCTRITDASVMALADTCPGLTLIGLTECTNITDVSVTALAENCPRLNVIGLNGCTLLTDASVTTLAEHCPGLTLIDLTRCTHITERAKQVLREKGVDVRG